MSRIYASSQSVLTLYANWRALGLMLVACARVILQCKRAGTPGGTAKAEALSLWVQASAAALAQDLSEVDAREELLTEDAADAIQHMRVMVTVLLALSMFLQYLAAGCRCDSHWRSLQNKLASASAPGLHVYTPPLASCGFLDSS